MPRKQEKNTWYPLDNAGVLYSAIQKERYSAVYRFSALMTKAVRPAGAPAGCAEDHAAFSRLWGTDSPGRILVLF